MGKKSKIINCIIEYPIKIVDVA